MNHTGQLKLFTVTAMNKNYFGIRQLILLAVLLWCKKEAFAQHDSLIFKNGDIIVGEIKSMDKGILTIETDYSDKDFVIEWSGIKRIYSKRIFLVSLSDGRRINGSIQSIENKTNVNITDTDGQKTEALLDEIVFLKGLKREFWSRMKAKIDVGLSFTKDNNLRQLTVNTNVGYLAHKWQLDGYYNFITSSQDSVETIKRTDGGVSFRYFLKRAWFLGTSVTFLSNTEQALDLRSVGKLGAGIYLIQTNKTYWTTGAGLSFNNESFTNETHGRNSLEAYAGTELNMFDVGDLNLLSSLFIYPSLTESGRWRTDFRFDSKYDLPFDFYIKLGLTLNYDNKPAIAGNTLDYVLGFSVGWEL